ncbi:MAG: TIGR03936 family radical SAM-associated protein [Clostridia bacterium]|nr:TIGR03936 family radical SAM-associated protein [Clostridia bacterium]
MSKRRLKFSKTGMGKYISHLDLLRAFTRAITRAELPVRYTQGFNPHQIITFSLPLPIGVTSETEFVDIDFEETAENSVIMEKLNENLPPDIRILGVGELIHSATDIVLASYEIVLKSPMDIDREKTENFFKKTEIPVMKKTKKGDKEVNLAEYINSVEFGEITDREIKMTVVLSAGGAMNIKPDIMISALEKELEIGEFDEVYIHRTKIFVREKGEIKEMR